MFRQPISEVLESAGTTLLVGVGGGYDCLCCLPVYYELKRHQRDAKVLLASMSFVHDLTQDETKNNICDWLTPICLDVKYSTYAHKDLGDAFAEEKGFPGNYFPEWHLSKYLYQNDGEDVGVFTFDLGHLTTTTLKEAFALIVERNEVDTIILCDAGIDSVLKHDEGGLGTFGEDLLTLIGAYSVPGLRPGRKILMTLGMGSEGGVSDHHFLENWAAIQRDGGFLGSMGLHPGIPSVQKYLDAWRKSVPANTTINTTIAYAMEGASGVQHPKECPRARGISTNPQQAMACFFELDSVMRYKLWMDELNEAVDLPDLQNKMGAIRKREGLIMSYSPARGKWDSFAPHEAGYRGRRPMGRQF